VTRLGARHRGGGNEVVQRLLAAGEGSDEVTDHQRERRDDLGDLARERAQEGEAPAVPAGHFQAEERLAVGGLPGRSVQ
jgi:hypothetical protein